VEETDAFSEEGSAELPCDRDAEGHGGGRATTSDPLVRLESAYETNTTMRKAEEKSFFMGMDCTRTGLRRH